MSNNPYETNYSNLNTPNDTSSSLELEAKEAMLSMARWQTFFAILGVIMTCLMMLMLIGQVALVGMNGNGMGSVAAGLGATAFLLVIVSIFYVLPTIKLFQATAAIRKFSTEGTSLRHVMETQRSFWRTIGILAVVGIGLYLVLLFFMLSVSMFAGRF
jgi:hypothetical protein